MVEGKKIVVVLPAYNAAATLEATYLEIPKDLVDDVLLVDDGSRDQTVELAKRLGLRIKVHPKNLGYGGNQKTCYSTALELGADIVVMLHPDYQYSPKLLRAMVAMIASGHYDLVLGSRILGGGALKGGMPLYKYFFNRLLTAFQNLVIGSKLSEFHTGYRAYTAAFLRQAPLERFSDDFVFDNQVLAYAVSRGFQIGEISCPTRYFPEASSISFLRSVRYGLGVLKTSLQYHRFGKRRISETGQSALLPAERED
jgi:glycosyltransferase involved in cell wall biosynthesis